MAKILVVEDDLIIQRLLQHRLRAENYEVIIATNGVEGVALAQSELPDLILMDMRLPLLDGWQAVQQIRSVPETKSVPIIALTAASMLGEQQRCFEVGCDDYAAKPLRFDRLLDKIKTLLQRQSAKE